jgi:hypothetical protein
VITVSVRTRRSSSGRNRVISLVSLPTSVWARTQGQHATHGRLGGRPEGAGQRVAADPQPGQDLAGRVGRPLADRGQRPCAGKHRADRDAEHADQRVPSAAPAAGVGDVG